MTDPPLKRILYICLMAFATIPVIIGLYKFGAVLSLIALFFVALYIRSDRLSEARRQREETGVDNRASVADAGQVAAARSGTTGCEKNSRRFGYLS